MLKLKNNSGAKRSTTSVWNSCHCKKNATQHTKRTPVKYSTANLLWYSWNLNFLDRCWIKKKTLRYQTVRRPVQYEPSCSVRTARHSTKLLTVVSRKFHEGAPVKNRHMKFNRSRCTNCLLEPLDSFEHDCPCDRTHQSHCTHCTSADRLSQLNTPFICHFITVFPPLCLSICLNLPPGNSWLHPNTQGSLFPKEMNHLLLSVIYYILFVCGPTGTPPPSGTGPPHSRGF